MPRMTLFATLIAFMALIILNALRPITLTTLEPASTGDNPRVTRTEIILESRIPDTYPR